MNKNKIDQDYTNIENGHELIQHKINQLNDIFDLIDTKVNHKLFINETSLIVTAIK